MGRVAPIGGVCFLVGWAALLIAALTAPLDFAPLFQAKLLRASAASATSSALPPAPSGARR